MRAVGKRKTKNQPCKSPSPDIANRNIIKNTSIEVDNIRAKIQQAQEKVFRFELESSSSMMPELNVTLELKYRQLYEEFNRMRIENNELRDHNMMLGDQNKRLRMEHNQVSHPMIQSMRIKTEQQPFQEQHFNTASSQSRILLQGLAHQNSKNEQAERYSELLRNNEIKYRAEIDRLTHQNRQYEQQLVSCGQKVSSLHQQLYNKINQLNLRINKLQTLKRVIDEKHSRLFAQSQTHKTPPSTGKFEYRQLSMTGSINRERNIQSFLFTSPEGISKEGENMQRLQQQNHQLREQLRSKKQEMQRSTMEKQNLLMILKDQQRQASSRSSVTPFTQNIAPSLEQISRLQVINQEHQQELSQLKRENQTISDKLEEKEQEYGEQRNKLLDSIEHYRKLLEGYKGQLKGKECELCKYKDRQIAYLKQCLQKKEQKERQDFNSHKRQLQTKVDDYEFKLKQSEQKSSWENKQLEEQNQQLSALKRKLEDEVLQLRERLTFVRDNLQIDEATRLLNENYSLFCDLEGFCNKKEEDYNKSIMSYREKFLRKEQELTSMESQLTLKSKEVEVLQRELGRLKELRSDFRGQVSESGVSWQMRKAQNKEQKEKKGQFRNNQLKIIEQLKEGNQKLRDLSLNVSPLDRQVNTVLTSPQKPYNQ